VPLNFNTEIINHVMAKGLQWLYLKKREFEVALKRLLGCVCIFYAGYIHKAYEERISAWNNNGILGSNYCI